MAVRLVQFDDEDGQQAVACVDDGGGARKVDGFATTLDLATKAIASDVSLEDLTRSHLGSAIDITSVATAKRLRAPIAHPDPAHMILAGTGLTHLGSAQGRDKMHQGAAGEHLTDSMRMFNMGLDGGKPANDKPGVQPEWFYKGDGDSVVAPDGELCSPSFALDGGEESEIAGIYLIAPDGTPRRIGFTLANEFSDHITERGNYLWLAHSKLRPASLGPELLVGDLPSHVAGTSKIFRNGQLLWEKPFLSGEANMSHFIANLEHHHFKYAQFRRPGDIHVHFFGTATLSCADGIETQPGDEFEIAAEPFTLPLRNTLGVVDAPTFAVSVPL